MWLLAPILSLVALPVSGYLSDRYYARRGSRVAFIIGYTILASLSLALFPLSPSIVTAFFLLALMDVATQLNFEQYRAFTTEVVEVDKIEQVFVWQSFYICLGATISSILPFAFDHISILHGTTSNGVSIVVQAAFLVGALTMLGLIFYAVLGARKQVKLDSNRQKKAVGILQEKVHYQHARFVRKDMFQLLKHVPPVFIHLSIVQFFTWLAFITLWIYFTPAITQHIFGATNINSKEYYHGANWVGVCFAVYNFVALIYSLLLKKLINTFGRLRVHIFSLFCGAVGLVSLLAASQSWHLLPGMVGVGMAWTSLMAIPYNILVDAVEPEHRGFYLNVFSYCISLPKIFGALLLGVIIGAVFGGKAIYAILLAAFFFLIASLYIVFLFEKFSIYDRSSDIQ